MKQTLLQIAFLCYELLLKMELRYVRVKYYRNN